LKTKKQACLDAFHTTRLYSPDPKVQFEQAFGMGWEARQFEVDTLRAQIRSMEDAHLPGKTLCPHGDTEPLWCYFCNQEMEKKNENQ